MARPIPSSFLSRVEGTDRAELAALIDAYLARSPGRAWDAAAFAGSPAESVTDRVAAEWDSWELAPAVAGWHELLPALRNKASLKRREVVERLAEGLGARAQTEKVAAYYHEMETGALPPDGVSNKVLDALGSILGETRDRLRAAGAASAEIVDANLSVSFARKALADQEFADADMPAPPASPGTSAEAEFDRVDELFTGGPDADV